MRVFSGPMPASESAATTFTFAGNARQASVAARLERFGGYLLEVFLRRRLDDDARGLDEVVEREERGGRAEALEEALGLLPVARGRTDEPEARKTLVEGEAALPTDGAEPGDAHVHAGAHGIMPPGTRMTAAHDLRQPLERLYHEFDYRARVELDAIRFPLRYPDPRDREIVGLLSACLAYGRVDLFGRALQGVLASMGPSPAGFVSDFEPRRDADAVKAFL